jgi:septum formation protein
MKLILASASPRRKELLTRLDIPFETVAPDCDEEILPDETSEMTCQRLARKKAQQIAAVYPDDLVIGADTIVVLDNLAMGKPKDLKDAHQMLKNLSGRTHTVKTAVAFTALTPSHNSEFVETTEVTFYPLDEADIERYLALSPPLDKAGAYGIQDWSGVFVEKVHGCYHNVVGFPLAKFYRHLRQTGLWPALPRRNDLEPIFE